MPTFSQLPVTAVSIRTDTRVGCAHDGRMTKFPARPAAQRRSTWWRHASLLKVASVTRSRLIGDLNRTEAQVTDMESEGGQQKQGRDATPDV
jgi:hypothetical protein